MGHRPPLALEPPHRHTLGVSPSLSALNVICDFHRHERKGTCGTVIQKLTVVSSSSLVVREVEGVGLGSTGVQSQGFESHVVHFTTVWFFSKCKDAFLTTSFIFLHFLLNPFLVI